MNLGPILFLGTFFALATSWFGFVLMPQIQIGRQERVPAGDAGVPYPPARPGLANQGEAVYRANGCYYCHSQQVRPMGFGSDVERGWGGRASKVQSVAQDYLNDHPAMLGSQRIGPDLKNIGLRKPDAAWQLKHLYDPQAVTPGSTMPRYRYLFKEVKLRAGERPSPEALQISGVRPGYQIVPTEDAKALVAYLQSLRADAMLFETPPLVKKAPAPAGTNAPAGAAPEGTTNAPAATNNASTNVPAK